MTSPFPPGMMPPMMPPPQLPMMGGMPPMGPPPMMGAPGGFPPQDPMAGGMMPPGMPPPGMMPPQPPQPMIPDQGMDPVALLAALKDLVGYDDAPSKPMYPPWYKRPSRPNVRDIKTRADELYERHSLWRSMIDTMLRWTNQDLCGVFPEDRNARAAGLEEEFVSSALSDERNLVVAKLASMRYVFKKRYLADDLRGDAQLIEDSVDWLRREEEARHVLKGNRVLPFDEASNLVDYGMVACRHVFDPTDPDFPLQFDLIDPVQVYPVYDRRGIHAVYRVYRDTIDQVIYEYGDFTDATRAKLEKKFGKSNGDTEVPVVEYWDTWWRSVTIDDQEILPISAHEYGFVPWTIVYSALGSPMYTTSVTESLRERANGEWIVGDGTRSENRVNKAVPHLWYRIKGHETYEAVMARMLTAFKKEVNPPIVRHRSDVAAGKPLPETDTGPGGMNEAQLGEERLEPWPTMAGGPATQSVLQALSVDRATGSAPLAMYGAIDKSNVSGTAQSAADDAGMDKIAPHLATLQRFQAEKFTKTLQCLMNHGDEAKYASETPTPLMAPKRKARSGEAPAFELGRELIERVGPRIECTINKVNPRDWTILFNAGAIGVKEGFILPEMIAEMAGIENYDRMFEEWLEHQSTVQAFQHPKFAEMFTVPMAILENIKETSDPEKKQKWQEMLQSWMQTVAMQPQQQPGQPGPGGPPPGPPNGMAPQPQNPPMSAGTSYPMMGQGPGSQGAMVGRSSGPGTEP